MPQHGPLGRKLKFTKIALEFIEDFLMFGSLVVTESITVAVSLFTQITLKLLLLFLVNIFLMLPTFTYAIELFEAK